MSGQVVAIYIAAAAGAPMEARTQVRAVPKCGLEGDRYFAGARVLPERVVPGREETELTLIEEEVVEHLRQDLGLNVSTADSRRNIVTRSVGLNELVGAEFWVGAVLLRGMGLCEPCVSLVKSPENKHLLRGLVHKGGLRAQILTEGVLIVGDKIEARATRLAAVG